MKKQAGAVSRWKVNTALFMAPVLYGTGFVVIKDSLDFLQPNWILVFRYLIAAVVLLPFFCKKFQSVTRKTLIRGSILGLLSWVLHVLQNMGLQYTTAGTSAFLTSTYVVMTPFVVWGFRRKRPAGMNVLCAAVSLIGVGLISLNEEMRFGRGELLTLGAGLTCAVMLVVTEMVSDQEDALVLTFTAGLFSLAAALSVENMSSALGVRSIVSMLYLGIVVSGIAFSCQNIGLKHTDPEKASLVFALESVFGFLFGILFLKEGVTMRFLAGAGLVFASIVLDLMPSDRNVKRLT